MKVINVIIECSGASKVDLAVNAQKMISKIYGAAKVNITGVVDVHISKVSGAAHLEAGRLISQETTIEVSGASNANVYATKMLSGEESGVASLKYNQDVEDANIESKQLIKRSKNKEIQIYNTTSGDTTEIRIGDFEIGIFENDDSLSVRVGKIKVVVDDDGNVTIDKDNYAKKKKKARFNGHWAGFELGINGFLNKKNTAELSAQYDFLNLRYEKSIAVNFNFIEQNFNIVKEKLGLLTGLGIQYNNYRFDNDVKLLKGENELEGIRLDIEDRHYTKSKLTTSYLTAPLMIEFQTNSKSKRNSFHIGVGVQLGLRIGSHIKNVYSNNQRTRNKDKERGDFYLNPLKADAMARIGWGKINLFGTYTVNSLFRDNKGPELYPFTLGISLASW